MHQQQRPASKTSEQATQPLDIDAARSAAVFRAYVQQYELHPLDVSITSKVRYLSVWNLFKGKPITADHAARVRLGLYTMTSVPYIAPILLLAEQTTPNHEDGGKRGSSRRRVP